MKVEEQTTAERPNLDDMPDGRHSTRGGKGAFGVEGVDRKKAKSRKLTNHQWGELLGLLKTGHYTQKELASMYGVSVNAILTKRKKLGGIKIGESSTIKSSLAAIDKTAMALEKAIGFSTEEAGRLITEAKRETFKRNEMIGKLAERMIGKKVQDGTFNFAGSKDDIKVLLDFQLLFEKQLKLTGLCLGFEDGKFDTALDAPVLTIHKMTEEDIADAQSRMVDSDSDEVDDFDESDD